MSRPPALYFHGNDRGDWSRTDGFVRGDWYMISSMSRTNDWRNFSVEGATEYHPGFRRALHEIVAQYPDLLSWVVSFDGPYRPILEVLSLPPLSWHETMFFHGTSEASWQMIALHGLCPRSTTGRAPAYGAQIHAEGTKAGNPNLIYLTTQRQMAAFAARDAARGTGTRPIIIATVGVPSPEMVEPDEDSREPTAVASVARMGSFAYRGCIPGSRLQAVSVLQDEGWTALSGYVARLRW